MAEFFTSEESPIRHFFWRFGHRFWKSFFLFFTFSLVVAILDGVTAGLLVPLFLSFQQGAVLEDLSPLLKALAGLFGNYSDTERVYFAITALVVTIVLKNLLVATVVFLSARLSSKLVLMLRDRGFYTLMHTDLSYYSDKRAGNLVEQLLGHSARLEYLVSQAGVFIVNIFRLLVLFIIMFLISWKLTIVTVVSFSIIYALLQYQTHFIGRAADKAGVESLKLSSHLYESISGIREIKIRGMADISEANLRDSAKIYQYFSMLMQFGSGSVQAVTESLGMIAIGLICLIGVHFSQLGGPALLVQLIPFLYILTRVLPAIKELNRARAEIGSRLPFARRVVSITETVNKPFMQNGNEYFHGMKKGIFFKGVNFTYTGEKRKALNSLNIFIPARKTTAIAGHSGAGKSTIINLLLRLYDPDEGDILIDDKKLKNMDLETYRQKIGVVSQENFIFHSSVYDNIALYDEGYSHEDIVRSAKAARAHDFIKRLQDGYDTVLGDRGIKLSGGERQRISIARALLRNPQILILDEATNALDSDTEAAIHETLESLSGKITILIIAHRDSSIAFADNLIALKEGQVSNSPPTASSRLTDQG